MENFDVIVIGAGPAGSVCAANLRQSGLNVCVVEKSVFPRFQIGESLLPQAMIHLKEAGLLKCLDQCQFQKKDGALFSKKGEKVSIDFSHKSSSGPYETFQVNRAQFDQALANEAQRKGAHYLFGTSIKSIELGETSTFLVESEKGHQTLSGRFVVDASGNGAVLPKMLGTLEPSDQPKRVSAFTHWDEDARTDTNDHNKILIGIHDTDPSIWYWLIPFSDGRCSVGVICEQGDFDSRNKKQKGYFNLLDECEEIKKRLSRAKPSFKEKIIKGYSHKSSPIYTDHYCLVGNSAGFIDPVFSSGLNLAMTSASLASSCIAQKFQGESPDWLLFNQSMDKGHEVFSAYVDSWYDQSFQKIIFAKDKSPSIFANIVSILAGYCWDERNPFVSNPRKSLQTLSNVLDIS